jgi:hypothetical protein
MTKVAAVFDQWATSASLKLTRQGQAPPAALISDDEAHGNVLASILDQALRKLILRMLASCTLLIDTTAKEKSKRELRSYSESGASKTSPSK